MAGIIGVVGVFFVAAMLVTGYVIAAHRARGAADLAALSAAGAYQQGDDPCVRARQVARANGARVTSCDRVGDLVDFVVSVRATVDVNRRVPGLPRSVGALAHAGPTRPGQ